MGRPKGSFNIERVELVRKFASEGLTLSEMAARLHLSRQRVHQILQKHGIEFRRLKPYDGVRSHKP